MHKGLDKKHTKVEKSGKKQVKVKNFWFAVSCGCFLNSLKGKKKEEIMGGREEENGSNQNEGKVYTLP